MVTGHVAVWFPWLSNELNRVDQPILIECKIGHGLNEAVLRASGGGGGSESMDGWECAILALELVPKNLIFA